MCFLEIIKGKKGLVKDTEGARILFDVLSLSDVQYIPEIRSLSCAAIVLFLIYIEQIATCKDEYGANRHDG